jgi:hypothetical protein
MSTPSHIPTQDAISDRARKLWQAAGSPEGQDLAFWLRAENELREESGNSDDLSSNDEKETSSSRASGSATVRTPVSMPGSTEQSRNPFAKSVGRPRKSGR